MPKTQKVHADLADARNLRKTDTVKNTENSKAATTTNINVTLIPTHDIEVGGEKSDNFISKSILSASCANEKTS